MFVRRAARTVRGFLKRGSARPEWSRTLQRATAPVIETMEGRRLLSATTLEIGEAVVGFPDGSAVVGGTSMDLQTFDSEIALVKYDADGVRQPVALSGLSGQLYEMVRDSTGRIVAAGAVGGRFAIVRFKADLTLDADFGNAGVATAFDSSLSSNALDLVIQSDGKIIAVGDVAIDDPAGLTTDIAVARFTDDGNLDTTFGDAGMATADMKPLTQVSLSSEGGQGVALDGSGRIVVATTSPTDDGGGTAFGLVRFTPAGALDPTFGTAGRAVQEVTPGNAFNDDRVADVQVMTDGKIVLAGTAYYESDAGLDSIALARFTDLGSIDTTFGSGFADDDNVIIAPGNGISIHLLDTADPFDGLPLKADAKSLAIIGTRLVVVATVTQTNGVVEDEREIGLFGFTLSGYRDTSFGEDGDGHPGVYLYDTGVPASFDWDDDVRGMAVTATHVFVVGATSNAAPPDFLLGRFALDTLGGGGNQLPVADPGADYSVGEGASISLDGSASADPDGSIVSYEWDLDYDGVNFNANATGATPTFSAAGIDGTALRLVALRVTDDLGASNVQAVQLTVTNALPVASISGDLTAVEGSPVFLTGAFTDACATDAHTTLWQVVASTGQTIASGTGASFGFTPVDDGTYAVTFTVTDDDGGVGSATVDVVVTNAQPDAALVRDDADPVVRQWEVKLTGSFTDAGADSQTLAWHIVDAGGVTVASGAGTNVQFTPVSGGAHVVTFSVTDDDGGVGTANVTVNVLSAAVVSDVLRVGGTSLADDIDVEPTASGTVRVRFAGVSAGAFAPTKGVIVRAGRAGDNVTVVTGLARQTSVYGGAGPDTLTSGNGGDMLFGDGGNDSLLGNADDDVLVGGDGNDLLVGGKGDDLLIGGLGADSIVGNANDDVIVGGWTLHDGSPDELRAVHRIWLRRLDYLTGVADLRVAGVLLEDETVFDDGARDVMTGEGGKDVFYGNFTRPGGVLDVITDLRASEFAADLDLIMAVEA